MIFYCFSYSHILLTKKQDIQRISLLFTHNYLALSLLTSLSKIWKGFKRASKWLNDYSYVACVVGLSKTSWVCEHVSTQSRITNTRLMKPKMLPLHCWILVKHSAVGHIEYSFVRFAHKAFLMNQVKTMDHIFVFRLKRTKVVSGQLCRKEFPRVQCWAASLRFFS